MEDNSFEDDLPYEMEFIFFIIKVEKLDKETHQINTVEYFKSKKTEMIRARIYKAQSDFFIKKIIIEEYLYGFIDGSNMAEQLERIWEDSEWLECHIPVRYVLRREVWDKYEEEYVEYDYESCTTIAETRKAIGQALIDEIPVHRLSVREYEEDERLGHLMTVLGWLKYHEYR